MDKIVMQSSRALPNCDNYAIGVFQDSELHITPLKGIVQMRPEFNYLDKIEKRGKDEGKNNGDGKISFIYYL
jgi:DNA-directed RNA polymerase-3 subunit RPC5